MPGQGKKGAKKAKIEPLELNKETIENLSDDASADVKGGLAGLKVTDMRSANKCCSMPCVQKPR